MANAIYPLWKQEIIKATSGTALNGSGTTGVYTSLLSASYTYSAAHQFFSSLAGIQGTDQEITGKSYTTGLFSGGNLTYTAVTGSAVTQIALYVKNAGANTTWALFAFEDTGVTGLPVTPNGGNITITWSGSGIIQL